MIYASLTSILNAAQVASLGDVFTKPTPGEMQNLPMPDPSGSRPADAQTLPGTTVPTGGPSVTSDPIGWLKWQLGLDPNYWAKGLAANSNQWQEWGISLLLVAILLIAVYALLTANGQAVVIDRAKAAAGRIGEVVSG